MQTWPHGAWGELRCPWGSVVPWGGHAGARQLSESPTSHVAWRLQPWHKLGQRCSLPGAAGHRAGGMLEAAFGLPCLPSEMHWGSCMNFTTLHLRRSWGSSFAFFKIWIQTLFFALSSSSPTPDSCNQLFFSLSFCKAQVFLRETNLTALTYKVLYNPKGRKKLKLKIKGKKNQRYLVVTRNSWVHLISGKIH